MYVATERETSDNTEATRFSQCAHDQRRRLEAEDCNSIQCAQLISGGRRRIRPCPPHCLAHARPTMCCIRLVIVMYRGFILLYFSRYYNVASSVCLCFPCVLSNIFLYCYEEWSPFRDYTMIIIVTLLVIIAA